MFNSDTDKAVVVAFDHGTEGAVKGGEDMPTMMRTIAASSADAVLLTTGSVPHFRLSYPDNPHVIAGLDIPVFSTRIGSGEKLQTTRQPWTPEDAHAAGADMCKVLVPLGLADVQSWADALERIGRASSAARRVGHSIMLEPAFWGPQQSATDEAIIDAARLCVELGADVLKIPSLVETENLKKLVRWSPVPVLILGGTPRDGGDFLGEVNNWIGAGAAGVVVGRNIWNRPEPIAAIEALSLVVHERDIVAAHKRMLDAGEPLHAPALRYDER